MTANFGEFIFIPMDLIENPLGLELVEEQLGKSLKEQYHLRTRESRYAFPDSDESQSSFAVPHSMTWLNRAGGKRRLHLAPAMNVKSKDSSSSGQPVYSQKS